MRQHYYYACFSFMIWCAAAYTIRAFSFERRQRDAAPQDEMRGEREERKICLPSHRERDAALWCRRGDKRRAHLRYAKELCDAITTAPPPQLYIHIFCRAAIFRFSLSAFHAIYAFAMLRDMIFSLFFILWYMRKHTYMLLIFSR